MSHSQVPSRAASSAARRRSSLPRSAASARGGPLNYAEAVLPIRDGLAKLRDFPAQAGGSGEAVPE